MTTSTQQQYTVDVEGIGVFHFARRTMRHEFRVQAEYSRLTEGVETPTANLEIMAAVFAQLRVLTVLAPEGWDLDTVDPLDPEEYERLVRVHAAMRAKEGSFRRPSQANGQAAGPGNVGKPGVSVPPAVPAAAD